MLSLLKKPSSGKGVFPFRSSVNKIFTYQNASGHCTLLRHKGINPISGNLFISCQYVANHSIREEPLYNAAVLGGIDPERQSHSQRKWIGAVQ